MLVRVKYYKAFRGRSTGVESTVVPAEFVKEQTNGTTVVKLYDSIYGYPKGHVIAIRNSDIVDAQKTETK
jgi:hypothetical protein